MNRIVYCTEYWHNNGGYKLSAYMGVYQPNTLYSEEYDCPVFTGGAKNDKYIFFCKKSERWVFTDCKTKIPESIGTIRSNRSSPLSTGPPENLQWQVYYEPASMWHSMLYSEKGWISMNGFMCKFK
jgi:hypothetical protein